MKILAALARRRTQAAFCLALLLASSFTYAAKPPDAGGGGGGGSPTCTISTPPNDSVAVTTGGSELFKGVVSGGEAPYYVTWTFQGGDDGLAPAPIGETDTATETLANSGDETAQYDVAFY